MRNKGGYRLFDIFKNKLSMSKNLKNIYSRPTAKN